MAIKLIASDLDGTIIDEFNTIANENKLVMQEMKNKNIGFAISTGKTYSFIKDVCKDLDASYGIFGNGIQIVNLKTGEEIFSSTLDINTVLKCIEIAKSYHFHVHFYTDSALISEELLYMDLRNSILNSNSSEKIAIQIVPNIYDFAQKFEGKVYRFIISGDTDLTFLQKELEEALNLTITLIDKHGKYKDTIINKEYQYLDITPQNTNKGHALNILRNHLKISSDEVMAIGDNKNDEEMLKEAGIGVAVSNATENIKNIASYVTTASVEKGAFAEAIKKFIV